MASVGFSLASRLRTFDDQQPSSCFVALPHGLVEHIAKILVQSIEEGPNLAGLLGIQAFAVNELEPHLVAKNQCCTGRRLPVHESSLRAQKMAKVLIAINTIRCCCRAWQSALSYGAVMDGLNIVHHRSTDRRLADTLNVISKHPALALPSDFVSRFYGLNYVSFMSPCVHSSLKFIVDSCQNH